MEKVPHLSIFYDGQCPLCVKEMDSLRKLNAEGKLAFIDIEAEGFTQAYPNIDKKEARTILHGLLSDGQYLYGLDVGYEAWRTVAEKQFVTHIFAFSRLPIVKPLANLIYRFFAKYRNNISLLLTGKSRCDNGNCRID